MKKSFFPRLAWTGIRKNRALYVPYLLTCTGMVMMYYIMQSLSDSPLLDEMRGGGNMGFILALGRFVIAVFALIFLFYTNSFLIHRRYKEFGLYNVLGMDKRAICRVLAWENLMTAGISLAGGMGLGIAFSKLAELGLLNAIHAEVDYRFTVTGESILLTVGIFAVIFLLLFLRALRQVGRSNPLELLRSEHAGEKPPKANWVVAALGVVILGAAYYLAVSIESPLDALLWFFVAVIMVIVATYLLFIAGSVVLCRLLQRNKKYYYRKDHFVSVSSMVYRMKRNGAGLASICILSTMVLVMVSSTASLYFGANDSLSTRFPWGSEVGVELRTMDDLTEENINKIRGAYQAVFDRHGVTPQNAAEYGYASIAGALDGAVIQPDLSANEWNIGAYASVRNLYFVTLDDYNRLTDAGLALQEGEAAVFPIRCQYPENSLTVGDVTLNIASQLKECFPISEAESLVMPSLILVVPSFDVLRPLEALQDPSGDSMLTVDWYYAYDLEASDEETIAVYRDVTDSLQTVDFLMGENGYGYYSGCLAEEKDDFFTTYGGMFFLGIMLSIVFLFAAAMIIYYKQVSEGYEDRSRFAIMRKVGMTREDIRKSIDSQVLTVFFAPLLLAGVHLSFAFPLVWKILQLFNLRNLTFVILVTLAAFAVFGAVYAIIYKATARTYYNIVSTNEE
ncbi:MAG: ABC transporter permease [Clostridiales bacterium]|nr:ABC transporter permease [Candidatus Cacconaster stercorequi]